MQQSTSEPKVKIKIKHDTTTTTTDTGNNGSSNPSPPPVIVTCGPDSHINKHNVCVPNHHNNNNENNNDQQQPTQSTQIPLIPQEKAYVEEHKEEYRQGRLYDEFIRTTHYKLC
jgi:hypothetical protein